MLLFNKKLTAAQACAWGLVTEVFPDGTFQKEVWERLKAYASLPKNVSTLNSSLSCKLLAFPALLPNSSCHP